MDRISSKTHIEGSLATKRPDEKGYIGVEKEIPLARELFLLAEVVFSIHEDYPRLCTVRRADDAIALHRVQQTSGATVADTQATLQYGGRGLAHFDDNLYG